MYDYLLAGLVGWAVSMTIFVSYVIWYYGDLLDGLRLDTNKHEVELIKHEFHLKR